MKKNFLHQSFFLLGVLTIASCSREFQFVNTGHNERDNFQVAKSKDKKVEHSIRDQVGETPAICNSDGIARSENNICAETFCPNNEMLQSVSPLTSTKETEPIKIFVRSLSKQTIAPVVERKISRVVTAIKEPQPAQLKSTSHTEGDALLCAIVAIFIPPLGVALYEGITTNFWIDLILTLLFYVPGLIFALIVILG